METAKGCMFMFGCQDISVMIEKRKRKFLQKLALSNNVFWTVCFFGLYVKSLYQGIYHIGPIV